MLDIEQFVSYHVRGLQYAPMFCDITQCARKSLVGTHQCFMGNKRKNLNLSGSGIYRNTVYIYCHIILSAGTLIYASSVFWPSAWDKTQRGQ
jgi:hypothetical protein